MTITAEVSTLTRRESRVRRASSGKAMAMITSFNPHPARKPGATQRAPYPHRRNHVSTLTRRESRVRREVAPEHP